MSSFEESQKSLNAILADIDMPKLNTYESIITHTVVGGQRYENFKYPDIVLHIYMRDLKSAVEVADFLSEYYSSQYLIRKVIVEQFRSSRGKNVFTIYAKDKDGWDYTEFELLIPNTIAVKVSNIKEQRKV